MFSRRRVQPVCGTLLRAGMLNLHPVTVSFATCLELTGFRALLKGDRLELGFRWRLLHRPNRPLACFLYAWDPARVSTPLADDLLLDHTFLPPDSRAGDELFAAVTKNIGELPVRPIRGIEFGLVDVEAGFRLPVCATSLPVTDEFTAVRAWLNETPPPQLEYRFPWPVLNACRVVLEEGIELIAYSVQPLGEAIWIRLRWQICSRRRRQLRFFGQVLPRGLTANSILADFHQEIILGGAGSVQVVEQNLVRAVGGFCPSEVSIRAGLLDAQTRDRLRVLDSSLPGSPQERWFLLPLPADRLTG